MYKEKNSLSLTEKKTSFIATKGNNSARTNDTEGNGNKCLVLVRSNTINLGLNET